MLFHDNDYSKLALQIEIHNENDHNIITMIIMFDNIKLIINNNENSNILLISCSDNNGSFFIHPKLLLMRTFK